MNKSTDLTGLHPIDRVSVKDLALDRLKRYIFSRTILPGQRLPSERELAERLGIGRPSVREALKVLETIGLVESRIGEGTFLTKQSGASIGRTIGINLAAWGCTIIEICEARQIIEIESARVAAQRAEETDLQEMEQLLTIMEDTTSSLNTYLAADMRFHRIIAHTTRNAIIANITDNLLTLLEDAIHEGHADMLPIFNEDVSTHRSLFLMIANQDADGAAEMMRQHIQFATELWLAIVSIGTQPPETGKE